MEPYWPGLFAKALESCNVKELITNLSSGVGAAPAAGGGEAAPAADATAAMGLSASQAAVVEALASGAVLPLDQLSAATRAAVGALQGDLTILELRGVVQKTAAGFRLKP